jgi:hypothetical protein
VAQKTSTVGAVLLVMCSVMFQFFMALLHFDGRFVFPLCIALAGMGLCFAWILWIGGRLVAAKKEQ